MSGAGQHPEVIPGDTDSERPSGSLGPEPHCPMGTAPTPWHPQSGRLLSLRGGAGVWASGGSRGEAAAEGALGRLFP